MTLLTPSGYLFESFSCYCLQIDARDHKTELQCLKPNSVFDTSALKFYTYLLVI